VDKKKTLACAEIFKTLPPDALDMLAGKCDIVSFAEGEPLELEGRPAEALYIIAEGQVDYIKRMDEKSGLVLYRWGPGGVVGLSSCLDGGGQFCSAIAAAPTKALKLPADYFRALCETDPVYEHRVLTQALFLQSGRLRQATVRLREFLAKILK
jgi:CRP-like cAMP-binding protein